MRVVWTDGAADDLAAIVSYIRDDNPHAARHVAGVIFDGIMLLETMPYRGRKRRIDNSRELIFTPLPYVAVYEVIEKTIYIKAVRHTARDWAN